MLVRKLKKVKINKMKKEEAINYNELTKNLKKVELESGDLIIFNNIIKHINEALIEMVSNDQHRDYQIDLYDFVEFFSFPKKDFLMKLIINEYNNKGWKVIIINNKLVFNGTL